MADVGKRNEFNKKVMEILRPEILKLKDLMNYVEELISCLHSTIEDLANINNRSKLASNTIFTCLTSAIDLALKLDNLKDMKSCINNDFARYKRALGALSTQPGAAISSKLLEEQSQLQEFLSNPDPRKSKQYIFYTLREDIKRVHGHEEVLINLFDYIVEVYEKKLYVLPDERFQMIRVLPHLLLLIDGDTQEPKGGRRTNSLERSICILENLASDLRSLCSPLLPTYVGFQDLCLLFYKDVLSYLPRLHHFPMWKCLCYSRNSQYTIYRNMTPFPIFFH